MDKKQIINIDNAKIDFNNIIFWVNPEDYTNNAIIQFDNKNTRLRAGILILNDKKQVLLCEEQDEPGVFSLPGGGLDPGETAMEAAIREAKEEVFINVKNAVYTGFDYCETHTELKPWVIEHVPKELQWYNYYTCLILAEYDSEYRGKVNTADLDLAMHNSSQWYDIQTVINDPAFKLQWKKALAKFGYISSDLLLEDLEQDAIKLYGITTIAKKAGYILKDGRMLDFSEGQSYRTLDHRDVDALLHKSYDPIMEFMLKTGAIRFSPELPGFYIINEPTAKQIDTIRAILKKLGTDGCTVDLWSTSGHTISSWEYDRNLSVDSVLLDIQNYFKTGAPPEDYLTEAVKNIIPNKINFEHKQKIAINEDTRNALITKSRNQGLYKDQTHGKNRFERKRFSKIATTVKQYNQIDMNDFFKRDILTVTIPVTGESNNYEVTIKMEGVVAEIQKNIKSNNNQLEFKTILQALTKVFNSSDIYVKCTCLDHTYRFAHWNIIKNVSVDGTDKDPGPGRGIRNPNDDKGRGCKHILLCLNNGDWLMKVASCIKNYIFYTEEHMQKAFLKIIFPKLYGLDAETAIEQNMLPEEEKLESDKHIIETINDWAKNRGKYKPGTNKNPVSGSKAMNMDNVAKK